MKNILFVLLIIFILLSSLEAKKKKKNKNKIQKKHEGFVGNCILTNSNTSMNLKTYIFDHRDDDLNEILKPSKIKLDKKDIDIIEECKKKAYEVSGEL